MQQKPVQISVGKWNNNKKKELVNNSNSSNSSSMVSVFTEHRCHLDLQSFTH